MTVPCVVVGGDRPVHVRWFHEGRIIHYRQDISSLPLGETGAILNIPAVDSRHAGKYTCKAENKAGVAEFSADLHVTGRSKLFYLIEHCMKFH